MPARILVVEQDKEVLAEVEAALKEAGYEVATATTPWEGLARLCEVHPDLIIADTDLPMVNGEEALLRMRQASYVLIMALGHRDEAVDMLEFGADSFLTKPPRTWELVARVGSLLRRKCVDPDPPSAEVQGWAF